MQNWMKVFSLMMIATLMVGISRVWPNWLTSGLMGVSIFCALIAIFANRKKREK